MDIYEPEEESVNDLETLWDALLSREAQRIRTAFASLDADAQAAILHHLMRMATEPDWHSEQRLSAQAALEALGRPLHRAH